MLGLLCIGFIVSPFIIYLVGGSLDRFHKARDQRIQAKCKQLAALFEEIGGYERKLARIYLQASSGNAYPFDLFMVEYYGGQHIVDTIWLPVRDFLNASDDQIKQVLAQELAHPGKYTIPDWTEALFHYVVHHKQESCHQRASLWSSLLSGR